MIGRHLRAFAKGDPSYILLHSGIREMGVPPLELAVVEFRMERDVIAGVFGDMKMEVGGVGGAGRDEMDVDDGAGGPGIALVDGIAVAVNLKRFVEMRAGFDGTFAVVFDLAAPENGLAFFVGGLEFEPDIEGVHGAAGEEVADLAGADDYVNEDVVASANGGVHAAERGGDGTRFARGAVRSGNV